ncbi:MAG TPA: dihydrolipoamide acetyltransferase family protein [Caldilineaceae bacterium]|nr:dihydrolipoamide acetyltransferase family protein [Caldilineaceae bacterium]
MAEFKMPSLGADMEVGQLLEWMVKPGAEVKRGDIIAVVGTEKGEIEVEVFEAGIVEELLVSEGTEVPVGAPLAHIRGEGEAAPVPVTVTPQPAPVAAAVQAGGATVAPAAIPPATNGHRPRVSPLARKLAAELGVDLTQITGSGANGAITREDVEAAAKAEPMPAQAEGATTATLRDAVKQEEVKQKTIKKEVVVPKVEAPPVAEVAAKASAKSVDFATGMRHAIALAMARANRDIPHYYLQTRIDMQKALVWLEAANQKRSIKERVLPAVLLIRAVAKALTQFPELNGYWVDDHLQPQEAINIGFAIALRQGGLVTPAIHNADLMSIDDLMEAMRDLIMRTRAGRLRSSELTDSTITLTNLGDLGVETVYGVIYPPQVALVGLGKITDQPWAEHGMLGIRPVLTATIAGDHRATDGRTGAQFLDLLNKLLQEPEKLWSET